MLKHRLWQTTLRAERRDGLFDYNNYTTKMPKIQVSYFIQKSVIIIFHSSSKSQGAHPLPFIAVQIGAEPI